MTIKELKLMREHVIEELSTIGMVDNFNKEMGLQHLRTIDLEIARLENLQSQNKGGE